MLVRASSGSGGGGGGSFITPTYNPSLISNVDVIAGVDTANNKAFIIGTFVPLIDISANTVIFSGIEAPSTQTTISDSAIILPNLGAGRTAVITTSGTIYATVALGSGNTWKICCYYDL